jgi:ABC-2 type transport system ATP-binding protein
MIEVRDVTKSTVDASRRRCELVAPSPSHFLGPNGAGKTTTLGILLVWRDRKPAALIDGARYADLASAGRWCGAGLDGFHPGQTGRNHLRVVARAAISSAGRRDGRSELTKRADRWVGGYSQGMRQRRRPPAPSSAIPGARPG